MIKRVSRDLGVLALGLIAVIAVSAGIGYLIVPRLDIHGLPDPDRVEGSSAVLVAIGDIDGRFILDRPVGAFGEEAPAEMADAVDFNVVYAGSSTLLGITAVDALVGIEIASENVRLDVALNGETFRVDPASCRVSLDSLEYIVLRPMPALVAGPPRGVPLPSFAGRIDCVDLEGLDTERKVDVHGVFRWEPTEASG